MRDRFSGLAAELVGYKLFEDHIDPNDRILQVRIAEMLAEMDPQGCLFIDGGSGTLNTAAAIFEANPMAQIIAIDLSVQMQRYAAQRLRERPDWRKRCLLVTGDLEEELSLFSSNANLRVNGFVSGLTVHNIRRGRQLATLRAAYRSLRAGAPFINFDKMDQGGDYAERFNARIGKLEMLAELGHPGLVPKWRRHELQDLRNLTTVDEHVSLLRRAGFRDVCVRESLGLYTLVTARA